MGMVSSLSEKSCPQFLIGFGVVNAYVPGVIGASVTTGWLFLLLTLPILLFYCNIRITIVHILGLLFLCYATLSFAWTSNVNIAFFIYLQAITVAIVFCIGSSLNNIKWFVIGCAVGLLPSDILATIQYFYKEPVVFTVQGNVAGLFVNKNIYCEVSAIICITLIVFKLWWYIPFTLPGIVYVHSRGAILGFATGLLVWLFKHNRLAFYSLSVTGLVVGSIYYIDNFSMISVNERFAMWADTIKGIKIFGQGVGSFEITYPYYATNIDTSLSRPRFAHNDLIQAIYEFGIGSILLVISFYTILKIKCDETIIIFSIIVMSMFNYTTHIPASAFILFLVAGYVSRNLPAVCDMRNSRGSYISKGFTTERN